MQLIAEGKGHFLIIIKPLLDKIFLCQKNRTFVDIYLPYVHNCPQMPKKKTSFRLIDEAHH